MEKSKPRGKFTRLTVGRGAERTGAATFVVGKPDKPGFASFLKIRKMFYVTAEGVKAKKTPKFQVPTPLFFYFFLPVAKNKKIVAPQCVTVTLSNPKKHATETGRIFCQQLKLKSM